MVLGLLDGVVNSCVWVGNLVHGVYDELGTRYDLPDYCISEPRNLVVASPEDTKHEGVGRSSLDSVSDPIEDLEELERRREEKGKRVVSGYERRYRVVARLSDRGGRDADVSVVFDSGDLVRNVVRRVMEKGGLDQKVWRVRIAYLGKM